MTKRQGKEHTMASDVTENGQTILKNKRHQEQMSERKKKSNAKKIMTSCKYRNEKNLH